MGSAHRPPPPPPPLPTPEWLPSRSDPPPSRWSLPIGRLLGIQVRVHATFLLLLVLVVAATRAAAEPVLPALGWIVALFSCVLVHELAHSVVARRRGIGVHEIDLLPIGGMSRLERTPDDWRDELSISAAGPAMSAALAAAFAALAVAAGSDLWPPDLYEGAMLGRLAWVNAMLAAFNLVPAFPLDGGRVLRAVLERNLGRERATVRVLGIGRVLSIGMIAIGLLWNVWLSVIGAFVWAAGRAEGTVVDIQQALRELPVGSVCRPRSLDGVVTFVDARTPVAAVLEDLASGPVGVVDGPRVLGVVRLEDVDRALRRRAGSRG